MRYRRLGSSGLQVSELSFGSWVTFGNQVDRKLAVDCMKAAFDAGCNFFDNAEVYAGGQSETVMGEALQTLGWDRSEYVVSTKIFWGGKNPNQRGLSRKHIIEGTEKALERLRVDYVDLVFCHRPDSETPIEESVRAMSHLVDSGKALYWGTSEWSAEQLMDAYRVAREQRLVPPTMEQPQYNMFHRERVEKEYAPLYEKIGLGTTVWSPLASGLLTGKYAAGLPRGSRATLEGFEWLRSRFEDDEAKERIAKTERLRPIASDIGCSLAQLALAWCLKNGAVSTVITGASRVSQVEENMKAVNVLDKLDGEVFAAIESILDNAPKPEPNYREW
jgi:voltage-dependent potassium channel beta subunit